jgi:hypothetical protein
MISFNNIGYMGRLGNQMFQYAALKGIATHKGYWYSIPQNTSLSECFKIPQTLSNNNCTVVNEKKFEFDEDLFNNCPDDVDICGYFQSEKYFMHIENQIRQDFTFHDSILDKCIDYKSKNFFDKKVISVHIRRTDYITDSNFQCLPLEYYNDALKLLSPLPIIIFSDDIKWCKNVFTDSRFTFSPFSTSFEDLCLMSLCDYHIIANSSFSWWGSWLAKSKQIIAPKTWFYGEFSKWSTKDLYLSKWIVI